MSKNFKKSKSTPIIPVSVYKSLPKLLIDCSQHFKEPREKDLNLLACITILSGCMPNVLGSYEKSNRVGPNLYCLIIAPPGSRKGSMTYSKWLATRIQKDLLNASNLARENYKADLAIWEKNKEANKSSAPTRPKCPILFIPGNSSSASIYDLLNQSDGRCIIFETEADTLTGSIRQEWGNFSDMLRKGFHHEPLSISRKGNNEYFEIDYPCLSILLSGTPSQVPALISSAEDGLFSRNMYYIFEDESGWVSPKPNPDIPDLDEYFQKAGDEVYKIYSILLKGKYKFKLTNEQFDKLSDILKIYYDEFKEIEGDLALSIVKRMGWIAFRIAMIFTVLRKSELLASNNELICDDIDLNSSLEIAEVLLEHSRVMFGMLPKNEYYAKNNKLNVFFSELPSDQPFAKDKANEIGSKISISPRSTDYYLARLIREGQVEKKGHGLYQKVAA